MKETEPRKKTIFVEKRSGGLGEVCVCVAAGVAGGGGGGRGRRGGWVGGGDGIAV